jgi:uncharacterized protein involved in type VI secretion and phage assembly
VIASYRADGAASCYFGIFPAIVTNIVDPDSLGRIEVKFPWLGAAGESDVRAWATLLTPYADSEQGFEFLPAVKTEVAVVFEAGNLRRPYIVGSAWNGKEKLPQAPEAANNKRLIRTRSGSLLEFDDTKDAAKITLSTKSGHKVVLDDGQKEVTVSHANGCVITCDNSGEVTITAIAGVTVNASAGVTVNAPSSTFSGNVICQGLTATSVTSPVYSPGAGNVW